jgi:hypothetical protein
MKLEDKAQAGTSQRNQEDVSLESIFAKFMTQTLKSKKFQGFQN